MAAGAAAPKSPSIVNSLPARWQQKFLSLEGYTVSNLGLQPGVSRLQGKIKPGGLYAREDGGGSRSAEGARYLAAATAPK